MGRSLPAVPRARFVFHRLNAQPSALNSDSSMKTTALLRRFAVTFALCAASLASAQTATLKADASALVLSGGSITFTAAANYDGQPSAVGWAIALPSDWTFVSVSGANVPEISPDAGSTGTLEFAYTSAPARRAEFNLVVRYPAGATTAKAVPTVLIRANGKLATLTPSPVVFGR